MHLTQSSTTGIFMHPQPIWCQGSLCARKVFHALLSPGRKLFRSYSRDRLRVLQRRNHASRTKWFDLIKAKWSMMVKPDKTQGNKENELWVKANRKEWGSVDNMLVERRKNVWLMQRCSDSHKLPMQLNRKTLWDVLENPSHMQLVLTWPTPEG